MKSKKLIILISVVVVIVAVVAILASVFAVRKVSPIYHNFDGTTTLPSDDAPTANDVLKLSKGKSIFFLSKDKLIDELNTQFPDWHALGVVKDFPNTVNVHFVKRKVAAKIDVGGNTVYLDTYGYVMNPQSDADCIDISSAFEHRDTSVNSVGKKLQFVEANNNQRLSAVIEAIMAGWRCYVELENVSVVLGEENVFKFDTDGKMIIDMPSGAQIKIESPSVNLTDRLIGAYSVYYNEKFNFQQSGVVITVEENGNIITPGTGN